MEALYRSEAPIALAPLRWNLQKLERGHGARIGAMEEQHKHTMDTLAQQHKEEEKATRAKLRRLLAKEKEKIPLSKRLQGLHASEDNLRRLHRHAEADRVRRELQPMEDQFWQVRG